MTLGALARRALTVLVLAVAFAAMPSTSALSATEITVGTIERPPFASIEDGRWSGFSIELVEEIALREGYAISWQEYDEFESMITDTVGKKVDLSAANISITSEREKTLDFSLPIYDSGIQIFTPETAGGSSMLSTIWRSGLVQFVGLAFLILVVVAHLVWFFERDGINSKGQDYFRDDYKGGIWDAFWWAFIIVTIGGFENERPEKPIGRVLAIFWILASIFFISTFTAKITTSLTVAQLQSSISTYQDLYGKDVGAPKGTSIAAFLEKQSIDYIEYDDFTDVLAAVESEQIEAGVGDAPVVQFYAANEPNSKILVAGEVFNPDKLAFAFPEESPLLESFNQRLVELREDGTYQKIFDEYFDSL